MKLVGLSDIAAELGISRQRVLQLRNREDFPDPVGETANGAIWDMDDVRRWARSGSRPAGRPRADTASRVVGNRFVLDEVPISGRLFSQVYRATDRRTGLPSIVKLLDFSGVGAAEATQFEVKLGIMGAIGHPNITPILGHGTGPDNRRWVAMPLAIGSLLDLRSTASRSPGAIADTMRQVCNGLASAHRDGIFHGGVKPQNILRLDDGSWALADFCLPWVLSNKDEGSRWFSAPELDHDGALPTAASDIYGLGKVLEAICADSSSGHMFATAISYATSADPAARYTTVGEFNKAINSSLTATQELGAWGSADDAADELRDKAVGAATPQEDLYRILEWAVRLDESSDNEMRALVRVLPWLTERALSTLVDQDPELFDTVLSIFGRFVERATFSNEECDELALFIERSYAVRGTPLALSVSIRCLTILGWKHERWSVRDVVVGLLISLQDQDLAASALSTLKTLDSEALSWNLTGFTLRALPTSIRIGLEEWFESRE